MSDENYNILEVNSDINLNNKNITSSINCKRISKKRNIGITIVFIITILTLVGCTKKTTGNKGENISNNVSSPDSFFIANKNYEYTLFSADGKQLSKEIFKSPTGFRNGASVVKNSDNQFGIISSSGKMVVEFGKYTNISLKGPLFVCTDSERKDYLLTSSGKEVVSQNGLKVYEYSSEERYVVVEVDSKYNVYDASGKVLLSFAKSTDSDVNSPVVSSKDEYSSIFYNGKIYVINFTTGKVDITIETENALCFSEINSSNRSEYVLYACAQYKQLDKEYYLVRDSKLAYKVSNSKLLIKNGSVYLDDDSSTWLLDESGNKKLLDKNNFVFINSKNYVVTKEGNNGIKRTREDGTEYYEKASYSRYDRNSNLFIDGVSVYLDGSEKVLLPCSGVETSYFNPRNKVYLLLGCSSNSTKPYAYYKENGEKLNNDFYRTAENFDVNGLAIVSLEFNAYYLINTKGEKVSDVYKSFKPRSMVSSEYYLATKTDGTEVALDKTGKEVLSGKNVTVSMVRKGYYVAAVGNGVDEVTVYNFLTKKEIGKVSHSPLLSANYYSVENDGVKSYYSYVNGKMFYEEK